MNLNDKSLNLVQQAIRDKQLLNIAVSKTRGGTFLDFGIKSAGSRDAGIMLSRICMSDLGSVRYEPADFRSTAKTLPSGGLPIIHVSTEHPLLACIASQYAGWAYSHDDFFGMVSGPARCLRQPPEDILKNNHIAERSENAVLVMETGTIPRESEYMDIASKCKVVPENVFICAAPTSSLAGSIQIVARSIETAMHKLFEIGFDLGKVRSGVGKAPLPPSVGDDMISLGWTNDCILYGSSVTLWLDVGDEQINEIGPQVPSNSSKDFGTPFLTLFKSYDCDFYKVDKHLFSPAELTLCSCKSGNAFVFGETRFDILENSILAQ